MHQNLDVILWQLHYNIIILAVLVPKITTAAQVQKSSIESLMLIAVSVTSKKLPNCL